MGQTHLFIIDPIEKLNLNLDSSLRMAYCLHELGHRIFIADSEELYWDIKQKSATAKVRQITFEGSLRALNVVHTTDMTLAEMSAIHMRKEPPFDQGFLTTTWLLDSAKATSKVINDPKALRTLNEKLAIFQFPEYTTEALVSKNVEMLLEFCQNHCQNDAIVKPLDLFGGKGIFRIQLNKESVSDLRTKLQIATANNTSFRLIQPFNSDIFFGEIRVFTMAGKPLAWCLKKPAEGQFFANTSAGATLHPFEPSKQLIEMATNIATKLLEEGVYLAGLDIIGDKLSEINITSPRLLTANTDELPYYRNIAKWAETFVDNS